MGISVRCAIEPPLRGDLALRACQSGLSDRIQSTLCRTLLGDTQTYILERDAHLCASPHPSGLPDDLGQIHLY